eukprot:180064-Alexandrium_andersonii.AAC.1
MEPLEHCAAEGGQLSKATIHKWPRSSAVPCSSVSHVVFGVVVARSGEPAEYLEYLGHSARRDACPA